ncbi:MAG: FAD-dependent oxidoreductase, partial [Anaerolineales bacterium]|nr:FAD-dependent oxidoreductase [Anaerolineales bacterium]
MTKAVLIVGGSIAGLQAALDLANSGLEVYLVERAPFLSGSKIALRGLPNPRFWPGSDACLEQGRRDPVRAELGLLGPLEAVKHPNIQVFTNAEVTPPLFSPPTLRPCSGQALGGMKGGRGDFQVEVQQHPRYVDM